MSVNDLTVEWYYVTSTGDQAGPVNVDELKQQYQQKLTNAECLCWNEGLEGWTIIKEVPQLLTYLSQSKLPPPLPKVVPTITLALPPLQPTAEVVPLTNTSPTSESTPTSPRTSTTSKYSESPATTTSGGTPASTTNSSKKSSAIAANHAKYKTLKKEKVNGTLGREATSASPTATASPSKTDILAKANQNKTLKAGAVAAMAAAMAASIPSTTNTSSPSSNTITSPTSATAIASPSSHYPSAAMTSPIAQPLISMTTTAASITGASSPQMVSPSSTLELIASIDTDIITAPPRTPVIAQAPLPSDPAEAAEYISQQLIAAVSELDLDAMNYWLNQGDLIQMDENHYVISPLARMYSSKVAEARKLMTEAVSTMEEGSLLVAVYYADSLGYDKIDVQSCRKLRDAMIQVSVEAKQQLAILDEKRMKYVLQKAERLGFTNAAMEQLRIYCFNTNEEKLRQLQLKAANALNDRHRAIRLTIALKSLVFKKSGSLFNYENYGKWRNAEEWAAEKLITLTSKNELAEGMKRFSKEPIHASLSTMTKEQSKTACRLFKKILGFSGDRPIQSSLYLIATEILTSGLTEKWCRDEIYLQLMKQLTGNPSADSERKLWQLFYLCLETFPPNSEMENIVEMFLNKHIIQGSAGVRMLHGTVYEGERRCVPSESEMNVIMSGKSIRHCAFEEERDYKVQRAVLPPRPSVQPLAGTVAADISAFIQRGHQPDWSHIDLSIPTGEELLTQLQALQPTAAGTESQPQAQSQSQVKGLATAPSFTEMGNVGGVVSPVSPAGGVGMMSYKGAPLANLNFASDSVASSQSNSRNVSLPPTPRSHVTQGIATGAGISSPTAAGIMASLINSPPVLAAPTASAPSIMAPPMLSHVTGSAVAAETAVEPSQVVSPAIGFVKPPPPPPPAAAPVCHWGKAMDPATNAPYYYHLVTREVTWDKPADYFE